MPNRMQEVVSKGMGKAKATKARLSGLKGVFKKLAEEHGEVTVLLQRVSKSNDPEVRAELFPKIRAELLSHERGELTEVYPLLRSFEETRAIAEEHEQEASELESLIEELDATSYESDEWATTFEQLVDLVDQHTTDEEKEYFPEAQEVLGDEATKELEERYLATKEREMDELD